MATKAKQKEVDREAAAELIPGHIVLTAALWGLVRRDAETYDRTESYIIRTILGGSYKLEDDLVNPPRKRRQNQESDRG